ncbi:Ion transport 2 domain protein (plasmid) [Haloterrigena turkmenica DSM 5511]|uniref:Ion transport 2 domain protein n=1 Tax=Haloterrigena turkmenica (strain ATCC 51198 / DSM 5511 / JCM 9101 / NCIMB 13204 / VKM B-1734 / 4k) TaxID=543526 RepID=D2S172_HALTV|nr:potassium channel family protein [Haloterrigena turkmenica]ADB63119.1 Ion transport 2 domain protein [Haloterrigena turkmenica DSM 5511]
MNLAYLTLGVALLAATVIDIVWTTLWIEGGAGPLTSRLMVWTWQTLRRIGGQNAGLLSLSGALLFVLNLTVWIVLLWVGWTLVFASAENAIIDTLNRGSVSWSDRLYFTGYTIFTLGNGDFAPRTGRWQIVTILATGSGLLFVTLSVTYALSVLEAVTQKRAFASTMSGFGTHGEEIVRTSWTGEEFRGLEVPLNSVASQLATLTENHKAYPILHYVHSARPDRAPIVEIVVLNEALTLLRFGVPERQRPNEITVRNARTSVEHYLETLHEGFVGPADDSPPSPDLRSLREAGIPTVSDDEFETALDELETRRRLLYGLVESDAREWPSREID